jgi:hypothetical protein
MKYVRVLLLALLLQPCLALSASKTCPKVEDFECLVTHGSQVFQEDVEHAWNIYRRAETKAKACKDYKDVTRFLHLWSGRVDGDLLETLSEDTEGILAKNGKCFFEGFLGLPEQEQKAFIARFCPLFDPEPLVKSLKQAAENPRYKSAATQLLGQKGCR